MTTRDAAIILEALVATSIYFVWVVRYPNIVAEFRYLALSHATRDVVGIVKLTCALLLLIGIDRERMAVAGGIGIAILMAAAFVSHLRIGSSPTKALPSFALCLAAVLIVWFNLDALGT